ncbi:MAG: dihydrofolate reductase [Cytophagales bacterium]
MIISAIVAADNNGVIGKDNQLLWKLKTDLKRFKTLTTNHHVLMGRKTYESIGKPLPNRVNLVVSRNHYENQTDLIYFKSVEEALELSQKSGETELFVIGGAQIYEQTRHLWNKVYFTRVNAFLKGDAFFENLNTNDWILTSKETIFKSETDEYDHDFEIWEKKTTQNS